MIITKVGDEIIAYTAHLTSLSTFVYVYYLAKWKGFKKLVLFYLMIAEATILKIIFVPYICVMPIVLSSTHLWDKKERGISAYPHLVDEKPGS